jgi:Phosphodiester glycosidase
VTRPVAPARQSQDTIRRAVLGTPAAEQSRGRVTARIGLRLLLALITTFVFVTGWSVGHALTAPNGGSASERVAEWARGHDLGFAVTFGEWLTYNPPKKGGKPNVSFNKLGGTTVRKAKCKAGTGPHCKKKHHGLLPIIPANLGSMAGKPLPGEGVWKEIADVRGLPAVFKTYIRFSKVYSSYYAGVVSMDQRLVKFDLRPGTEDPGPGNWGAPLDVPPGHRAGLLATFNSGFRIYASGGGFYLHGHYDGALVKGVASEVYYKDGRLAIGTWGRGRLHMGPDIAAVRQNLHLIVENGKVPAAVDQNVESSWGATLGGAYYVWRSGVGITASGRIIFVYGPSLDVRTLAELLKRAGCVSAMELDINPDWMSFMYYLAKNHPANPTPVNLLPDQIQPPDRYYYPSNRDFTAVFAR